MIPTMQSVEFVAGYTLRVGFSDGIMGLVDLESELWGEIFEPLRDAAIFRQFRLDKELNTIVWPTGADLAPEYLYERAAVQQTGVMGDSPSRG